jgi:uncharacterized cupin superfamily protein
MELLNPLIGDQFVARTVAFTGTAGSTGTWPAGPQGVVVWSDQACYILVGEGVTATTANGTPLPANTPVPFVVPNGTGAPWRVSAIQVSTGGTLYAKPINIR